MLVYVLRKKRNCQVGGGMSHHCTAALLDSKLQFLDHLRSGWSPGKRSVDLPGQYYNHPVVDTSPNSESRGQGRNISPCPCKKESWKDGYWIRQLVFYLPCSPPPPTTPNEISGSATVTPCSRFISTRRSNLLSQMSLEMSLNKN